MRSLQASGLGLDPNTMWSPAPLDLNLELLGLQLLGQLLPREASQTPTIKGKGSGWGTWVGKALLVLDQGDRGDGSDNCSPDQLQPDIQPLLGGTGGKLAPLVQLQESLVFVLKPGEPEG